MNFIFQGSQKMHVRVAISQKGLVNFFRYAHQIKAFFIPVHTPVSLFMGRFFPLKFHSARTKLTAAQVCVIRTFSKILHLYLSLYLGKRNQ